jgi:sulfite exporter TauE/SafE
MPFPLETLIATPLIGLLAYIILGISSFGSALVTIPLLVHFLPLQTVVPLAVLVDFLATATTGIRFREDVETAELKFLVPPMIAGILAGVTLLATLPKQATVILLGAFVTGYGVYRLIAKASTGSVSRRWGIPTASFGGLVGGLFGVGGPIYAAYLTAHTRPRTNARHAVRGFFVQHRFPASGVSVVRTDAAEGSVAGRFAAGPLDADRPDHRPPPARETLSGAGRRLHQCAVGRERDLTALESVLAGEHQSWNQYSPWLDTRL